VLLSAVIAETQSLVILARQSDGAHLIFQFTMWISSFALDPKIVQASEKKYNSFCHKEVTKKTFIILN